MKRLFILLITAVMFYHCGNDNTVNTPNDPADYTKIYTAETGSNKIDVYSKTSTGFIYGYNDIAFKVFINNAEQNSGYVKFKATMYHGLGGPNHSVPVSPQFNFNSDENLFTGYVNFIMYDTAAFWIANFNYNEQFTIDSSAFTLNYSTRTKIAAWDNSQTERTYFLTLIEPHAPVVGLNDVEMMLHETQNLQTFSEISNAEMFIRPWMESMGHGSSNNVDPVNVSPGRYKGTANFNMAGEWFLYDSIKVNGNFITRTPTPKFTLEVN
ncbi:MAG: FixH family protein [Ignavibacteria bacterium]|nr:FixH family protein [Ignavibacteria bacterium]